MDVDFARAKVRRDGRTVDLTKLEFKLLETFIRRRGRLLTRDQLLEAAWDHNTHVTDRAVDAHRQSGSDMPVPEENPIR